MAAEEEMKAPGAAKADTQRLRGLKSSKGVVRLRLQRKIMGVKRGCKPLTLVIFKALLV